MKYLFVAIIALCVAIPVAKGHEGFGFKHAEGDKITGLVFSGNCGNGNRLWKMDNDGNGFIDRCIEIRFIHDILHIKEVELKDGKCECSEGQ